MLLVLEVETVVTGTKTGARGGLDWRGEPIGEEMLPEATFLQGENTFAFGDKKVFA